jgi:hypothetical protein
MLLVLSRIKRPVLRTDCQLVRRGESSQEVRLTRTLILDASLRLPLSIICQTSYCMLYKPTLFPFRLASREERGHSKRGSPLFLHRHVTPYPRSVDVLYVMYLMFQDRKICSDDHGAESFMYIQTNPLPFR